MKNIIKYLFCAFALTLFATSCKDTPVDDNWNDTDKPATILSFGFYAADNPGVLTADYVLSPVPVKAMVRLPKDVDRSALVARFVLSSGETKTLEGGVVQTSGTTVNDYTKSIDFIVSDKDARVATLYTISVGNLVRVEATKIGQFTETATKRGMSTTLVMRINPVDSLPYFLYEMVDSTILAPTANPKVMGVVKWNGSNFEKIGGQVTKLNTACQEMTITSNGSIYVYYSHATDATDPNRYLPDLVKFTGGEWEIVGTSGFALRPNTSMGQAIIEEPVSGDIMVFSGSNSAAAPFANRDLMYNRYAVSTNVWNVNLLLPTRTYPAYGYLPEAVVAKDTVYMGVANQQAGKGISLYKYYDSQWHAASPEIYAPTQNTTGVYDSAIAADTLGNVYFAFADGTLNATIVARYNSKGWSQIGDNILDHGTGGRYMSIMVDDYGLPMMFYRQKTSNLPAVLTLDRTSLQWDDPLVIGTLAVEASNVYILRGYNNKIFASYISKSNNKNYIELYELVMIDE